MMENSTGEEFTANSRAMHKRRVEEGKETEIRLLPHFQQA